MRNVLSSLERVAAIALNAAATHDRGPVPGGRTKAAGDDDGLRRCFPDGAAPSDGCLPGSPAPDDGCFPGGAA
jgi:hypothetical protein